MSTDLKIIVAHQRSLINGMSHKNARCRFYVQGFCQLLNLRSAEYSYKKEDCKMRQCLPKKIYTIEEAEQLALKDIMNKVEEVIKQVDAYKLLHKQ